MLIFLQIATSQTFSMYDKNYTFEWSNGNGLVYTQLVLMSCNATMILIFKNYLRWKRRERVLNALRTGDAEEELDAISNTNVRDSSQSDYVSSGSLLAEEEEKEEQADREKPILKLFSFWTNLSIQQRSTVYIVISIVCWYLLTFLPVIEFKYSGISEEYLESSSESFTLYEIIPTFTQRMHSDKASWIGVMYYFEVLLIPQLLLVASILVKVIRYTDNDSEWIYPIYSFVSYVRYWSGVEIYCISVILIVLTLKFAVREISEFNEVCSDIFDVTSERCFEVKALFESGTWILLVYVFSLNKAILDTHSDLLGKLEPIADDLYYGDDYEEEIQANMQRQGSYEEI